MRAARTSTARSAACSPGACTRRRGGPQPPRAGFFAAKGLLGAALDAVRVPWEVAAATEPFLHPGRTARVLAGGEDVGWIGELHPLVARAWDLDHGAALFEIDLDRVLAHADAVPRYVDLELPRAAHGPLGDRWTTTSRPRPCWPSPPARPASCSTACASSTSTAASRWGRGASRSRCALAFRAADRTLTDEDVAPARERIVAALRDRPRSELRA